MVATQRQCPKAFSRDDNLRPIRSIPLIAAALIAELGCRLFALAVQAADFLLTAPRILGLKRFPEGQFRPKENSNAYCPYDPDALGRPAWNAGREVGVKKLLKQR